MTEKTETRSGSVWALMAGLACLPIYFSPAFPFLAVPGVVGQPGSIHWGLLLGPMLLMATAGWARPKTTPSLWPGPVLIAWLFVALLIGQFGATEGTVLALSFFGQLVLPVAFLLVGMRLGYQAESWRRASLTALYGLTAYQWLLIGANSEAFASGSSHAISESFSQFLTYYPGLIAIGLCVAITQWHEARFAASLFIVSVVVVTPGIWSRIGLTVICLAVAASVATRMRGNIEKNLSAGRLVGFMLSVVGGALGVALVLENALRGSLGDRLQQKEGDVFESGRQSLMLEALGKILEQPLLGDAGQALYDRADFGGRAGLGLRLFPSHSQILDLGIRGGVLAMFLGVLVALVVGRMAWRSFRRGGFGGHNILGPVFGVMIVASVSDLYFSQAITAVPGWLFVGLGIGALVAYESSTDSAQGGGDATDPSEQQEAAEPLVAARVGSGSRNERSRRLR